MYHLIAHRAFRVLSIDFRTYSQGLQGMTGLGASRSMSDASNCCNRATREEELEMNPLS